MVRKNPQIYILANKQAETFLHVLEKTTTQPEPASLSKDALPLEKQFSLTVSETEYDIRYLQSFAFDTECTREKAPNHPLFQNELTLVMCFPMSRADYEQQKVYLHEVKNKRGDTLPFSVVPIFSSENEKLDEEQIGHEEALEYIPTELVQCYRKPMRVNHQQDLTATYSSLLAKIHDVSLATPLYSAIMTTIKNLEILTQVSTNSIALYIQKKSAQQKAFFDQLNAAAKAKEYADVSNANAIKLAKERANLLHPIGHLEALLLDCLKLHGKKEIAQFIEKNRSEINKKLSKLHSDLEESNIRFVDSEKYKVMLANAIGSFCTILALCSLVGTYHAYHQFLRNEENHGSKFKFFATNPTEVIQATIASVERQGRAVMQP